MGYKLKTIWKFQLDHRKQQVLMPEGAEMLSVGLQGGIDAGSVCLWAMVDPDSPKVTRHIKWVGTGHPTEGEGKFIGTVILEGGALVFHFFDLGEV